MKLFICAILAIFSSGVIFSQYKINDACSAFTLNIEAKNLQSDSIRLLYRDCEKANGYRDTFVLVNGKTTITGMINRATEGILFTDIKNRWMDGPNVIRFIIQPGSMTLHFTKSNDTIRSVIIKGSYAENQKEAWEADNDLLLQARENYRNKLIQLVQQKDNDSALEKNIRVMTNKLDALQELLIAEILKYAKANPYSYFSGYLLNHYKRSIATDTLTTYYCYLDSAIIYSDFGKNILDELFKLTDDWAFREKFGDTNSYEMLKRIKTIYDVSLTNPEGTKTSFSDFKGNVILIDFWASWCGPCIQNAPYLKKIIGEMKNKPIKIVSVSIDQDLDTWKSSIKKYRFPGIHLFDEYGLLSTFYKVLWVPRYIIVNPDGTVANRDAPQAIDPQLKLILNNLLSKR